MGGEDSTVQYSTVQNSTVQYSTVQYSTVQFSSVQYSTVPTLRKPHSHHSALAPRDVHSHLEGSGGCGEAGHRVRAALSVLVDLDRQNN